MNLKSDEHGLIEKGAHFNPSFSRNAANTIAFRVDGMKKNSLFHLFKGHEIHQHYIWICMRKK